MRGDLAAGGALIAKHLRARLAGALILRDIRRISAEPILVLDLRSGARMLLARASQACASVTRPVRVVPMSARPS
jgi:hypothetical protein